MEEFMMQIDGNSAVNIEREYGLIVLNVKGLNNESYKPLFKREWANQDGVDVYMPNVRKKASKNVTIEFLMKDGEVFGNYENFITFVSTNKIDYWDTIRKKKVSLVLDGDVNIEWISYTQKQLHFNITFLNYKGRYERI